MKNLFILFALLLIFCQNANASTLDQNIDRIFAPLSDFASALVFYPVDIFGSKIPITILWILIGGVFFTLIYRVIAVWGFKHAVSLIIKKNSGEESGSGEVSSLQALGRGLSSMLVSFTRQLVVLLPVAYLLSLTGKLDAIWWAFPIAEIFSIMASLFFLRRAYNAEIKPMAD